MGATWFLTLAACILVCASADRGGSSLRGALEALQRRQRGRMHGPVPPPDYDALYEFVPPQAYVEPDYGVDVEDIEEEPKYVVKFLDDTERPPEAYEYKIIKKKSSHLNTVNSGLKKESPFRERSHHSDNDRLRDLFTGRNEAENKKETLQERAENDAEYAMFLNQLWTKYKKQKSDLAPQGVVKLYKEKIVKKRIPENWGPIAFKRKRSPDSESDRPTLPDYDKHSSMDSSYNAYDVSDDDKDDLREEYAIAFQSLDDDSLSDLTDDDQYSYDTVEKRFPVTKRSLGPYRPNIQRKRFAQDQKKRETGKRFRSSSGTDPKIIKDLSKIFGDSVDIIKTPVKRSSDHNESPSEVKPPKVIILNNTTNKHLNHTEHIVDSHELHGHNLHHPGLSGKEIEHADEHNHADNEKPIAIKKKSIDWSDYFGIDKRKKKSVSFTNNLNEDRMRKQYFDTFNKEVIYPLNAFSKHSNVKRNFVQAKPSDETEIQIDSVRAVTDRDDDKRGTLNDNNSKLDNIDKKLRNMEGLIVDEALHYSNVGEELDSKEEQEMKEKLLSRLAAAYSLEKMRKALKEFKQSLQTQRSGPNVKPSPVPTDEAKAKRVAVTKEKGNLSGNEIPPYNKADDKTFDFEDEQGAGHYLNGKTEQQFSEGYMGGSGRHRTPVMQTVPGSGYCPVLTKIVQRCGGVELLAGDRGQLFLPLCSLHQICYLCGDVPPTTCDLVFLSEADTTCEGDATCQRSARSVLMALRELHDSLADELDGECEASPCLAATLKLNIGWQRALQR